jgi:hypothetical protein
MPRIFTPFDEHHPDFFAIMRRPPREIHFTGQEQGIVEQTYLLDDEPTYDTDAVLDRVALEQWRAAELEPVW